MTGGDRPGTSTAGPDRGLWSRLEDRFGLVSLRPRLADDVRVRRIGEEWELMQVSTRLVMPLAAEDVPIVERFDGSRTVAELIVEQMGSAGHLSVAPVLSLVDRLVRAELLANYPPDLYRQLVRWLAHSTGSSARSFTGPASIPEHLVQATPAAAPPPRPRHADAALTRPHHPALVERTRFLRSVALLASLELHAIEELAELALEVTYPAAGDIVTEGTAADRFFIVRSGVANVVRTDPSGEQHRIAQLGPGDWFGEVGLLDAAPRNATVRAGTQRPVQVYSFDAAAFERVISPNVTGMRHRRLVTDRRSRLEAVPLFRALADDDLDRLSRALSEHHVRTGEVLFRQGDPADSFYVVVDGAVGVVRDGRPIAKINAGEFFGETALLFTETRTATVAAMADSRLWRLGREDFTTFVRDSLLHRRDLMPTVLGRLTSDEPT